MDDIKNINNEIHDKYMRRSDRFKKLLMSTQSIVFLHVEENNRFRFDSLYPEIKQYYPDSFDNYHINQAKISIEYAKKFMDFIINKYKKLNAYLILASNISETKYIKEYNIIVINTMPLSISIKDYNGSNISRKSLVNSILSNYHMINSLLNNNTNNNITNN
jgi:hypothetical protein